MPASLDSSAPAAAETKSKCKISKICQKFHNQNFEICSTVFLCIDWHIDHVCKISWESDKNCRRNSDLK